MSEPADGTLAGAICPNCGEEILIGQSVVRLTAGLLMADARLDRLIMRPDVYLHAGAGYDTRFDLHDRWCVTPDGVNRALAILMVSDETSASGH